MELLITAVQHGSIEIPNRILELRVIYAGRPQPIEMRLAVMNLGRYAENLNAARLEPPVAEPRKGSREMPVLYVGAQACHPMELWRRI